MRPKLSIDTFDQENLQPCPGKIDILLETAKPF